MKETAHANPPEAANLQPPRPPTALEITFLRGSLASRIAAQKKMHEGLMLFPEELRSHIQLGRIAMQLATLHTLIALSDTELQHEYASAKQHLSELVTRMENLNALPLTEAEVNALYDEVRRFEENNPLAMPELLRRFYEANDAWIATQEANSALLTPQKTPALTSSVTFTPAPTGARPSPAAMPKQRPPAPAVTQPENLPPHPTIAELLSGNLEASILAVVWTAHGPVLLSRIIDGVCKQPYLEPKDFTIFRDALEKLKEAGRIKKVGSKKYTACKPRVDQALVNPGTENAPQNGV